jgi:hypothetical protein
MATVTQAPDRRPIRQRVEEYEHDLDELRAAMRERSRLEPDSPEFKAALAHEDELLERIHRWSLGNR